MIGIDTNILVRYLTQDDPEQAPRANRLIETQCTKAEPGFIAHIVLCELVWVLRSAYGYSKPQVVGVLEQILVTVEFVIEAEEVVFPALEAYRHGPADFSDYLLILTNRTAGCASTYSFDTRLAQHPLVSLPE